MESFRVSIVAVMLFALLIPPTWCAGVDDPQIAVAVSSNAPAFEEAVAAFKTELGDDSARAFFVQLDNLDLSKNLISRGRPRLAVAFGSRAAESLAVSEPALPLVVSMVLAAEAPGPAKLKQRVSTVSL